MTHGLRAAFAFSLLLAAPSALDAQEAPAQEIDPARELAAAVDLPSAKLRRSAALRLASLGEVDLERWKSAMRSFGSFAPVTPGVQVENVELQVGKQTEETELIVYVPPSYDPQRPAPLLMMFHGTGASGRGQHRWWEETANALGMLVLCPSEFGPNKGYAFSPRERESALAALRWTRRRFNVDENRIYLTGISRGGHMCWDLAVRYPDLFAAIMPMIGGPRLNIAQGQNNLRYLENITHLPIRDLQGAQDDRWLVYNLRQAFAKLKGFGAKDAQLIEFPDLGHDFKMEAVDWKAFLADKIRNPLPNRIVRTYARKGEGRAFWAEVIDATGKVDENFRPRVDAERWKGMSDEERRAFIQKEAEQRTGRLEITREEPGLFVAKAHEIRRFQLLLSDALYRRGEPLRVRFGDRSFKHTPKPSKRVLLLEFVERFDRGFLPEVSISIPR